MRTSFGLALMCLATAAVAGDSTGFPVPEWLFPLDPPGSTGLAESPVSSGTFNVPDSDARYTSSQIEDFFAVPDWHPQDHPPMPEVVAHGRKTDLYACGYCHLPDGAGRPENATLAGLPAGYIVDQMAAFAGGARRSAWTGPTYLPAALMVTSARLVTPSEIAEAAAYFSSLALPKPRAEVVETVRVPGTHATAWVYAMTARAGDELLGVRIIEVPRDFERHELRDSRAEYVAYVPPGSIARGRKLTLDGSGTLPSCASCHGPDLRGLDLAPPLAGRSPTYLLRQLVAFRTGARHTREATAMQPVVDGLTLDDMIAAAAYAGSLQP